MRYEGVTKLIIDGGKIELAAKSDLHDVVETSIDSEQHATYDAEEHTLTVKEAEGRVEFPADAPIDVEVRSAVVRGELKSGRLTVGDVDVRLVGGPPLAFGPKTLAVASALGLDLLGVLGFSVFYWVVFALIGKGFKFDPMDYWSVELVLGAGTYYGYTGHAFVSTVIALLAIFARIQGREAEAAELSRRVKTVDVLKLALYLGIMAAGKVLRDYIDSFRREGWIGLRNRWRR